MEKLPQYILIVIFLLVSSCSSSSKNEDIYLSVEKQNDFYKININFDMRKIGQFCYYPSVFDDNYNKTVFKYDDSLLNSKSSLSKICDSLKVCRMVSENRKGQMKILILNYEIVKNTKILIIRDNFFDTIVNVKYPYKPNFAVSRDVYDLNDIRRNKSDKEIRILYFSNKCGKNLKSIREILFSNWITLNDN